MRSVSSTIIALMAASLAWSCSAPPGETVVLDASKRAELVALRREHKFEPNNFPPLGYTGPATPQDDRKLSSAVDALVDGVLKEPDGMLHARLVAAQMRAAYGGLSDLETEDRDRAQGYLIEVWYILGFHSSTGLFHYGAGFPIPAGYGEPLPPGWTTPDQPRHVGR